MFIFIYLFFALYTYSGSPYQQPLAQYKFRVDLFVSLLILLHYFFVIKPTTCTIFTNLFCH